MFKLKKPKLDKIKKFFKKWLRILGENPFLTSLALILLSLIIGSFIFYKYSVLVEEKEPENISKPSFLDEKAINDVLTIWQDRQKKSEEADLKTFPDPFELTK